MPNIVGATIPSGTVHTAKRIANRVISAQFIRERISVYGPEFKAARDEYLSNMHTWPSRAEAEAALESRVGVNGEPEDTSVTESERLEEPMAISETESSVKPKPSEPKLHQL